jgi:hypothetical protein
MCWSLLSHSVAVPVLVDDIHDVLVVLQGPCVCGCHQAGCDGACEWAPHCPPLRPACIAWFSMFLEYVIHFVGLSGRVFLSTSLCTGNMDLHGNFTLTATCRLHADYTVLHAVVCITISQDSQEPLSCHHVNVNHGTTTQTVGPAATLWLSLAMKSCQISSLTRGNTLLSANACVNNSTDDVLNADNHSNKSPLRHGNVLYISLWSLSTDFSSCTLSCLLVRLPLAVITGIS